MKILIILILTVTTLTIHAQEDKQLSEIETLLLEPGSILKKEYYKIGIEKGVELEVLKITKILEEKTTVGIRFITSSYSKTFGSESHISYVTIDEAKAIQKTLYYIDENKVKGIYEGMSTEIIFRSSGGMTAGAFWDKNEWTYLVKTQSYDNKSAEYIKTKDMVKVMALLDIAIKKAEDLSL